MLTFYPATADEFYPFCQQIEPFLRQPDKPIILALSRPDERKNILTLIEAYGESPALQDAANLLIIVGNRTEIQDMEKGPQTVLTQILLMVDSYNLYGKVAYPKAHRPSEVADIYRMAAQSGGVFINPALTEPFGLTLLEAAASGLPLVATENGGPVDIIGNCQNGLLIDPLDRQQMSDALLRLLCNQDEWKLASASGIVGVRLHYSWKAHAHRYMDLIGSIEGKYQPLLDELPTERTLRYRNRALFTDIDQTLIGNEKALRRFIEIMKNNRKCVTFGVATGRRIDSAMAILKKHAIPMPDVLISSLGTRIHYGKGLTEDDFWTDHIDHQWSPQRIRRLLNGINGLKPQPKKEQSDYKISYYYDAALAPSVDEITALLHQQDLTLNIQLSFGQFLDIIPARASKGQALRYVSHRLDIPLKNILVAGGSGADEDMMRGNTMAVVVSNRHNEELAQLTDQDRIFFANLDHAEGIIEAIVHYDFFNACRSPVRG